MNPKTWWLLILLCSNPAWADHSREFLPPLEEIKSLPGLEYLHVMQGQDVASHLSCTDEGGGFIVQGNVMLDDWSKGLIRCQGRWALTLQRKVGKVESHLKWRIVDAVALPLISFDPQPADAEVLRLVGEEHCEAKRLPNTTFMAVVRFGKRQRIDWRTGVEKAWTFDVKRGRIVPLSIKQIICEPYEA
jgi:hypothetical protein